jgi:hypothetical protein
MSTAPTLATPRRAKPTHAGLPRNMVFVGNLPGESASEGDDAQWVVDQGKTGRKDVLLHPGHLSSRSSARFESLISGNILEEMRAFNVSYGSRRSDLLAQISDGEYPSS